MTEALDIAHLRTWIGRSERRTETLNPLQAAALAATLDRSGPEPAEGEPLPPLWHWIYFLPRARASELGYDGHPKKGGFLPPVPLPRRMWAGGRLSFEGALHLGETVEKVSTIKDVTVKEGHSGRLAFVTVHHELTGAGGGRVAEEHDIVYRDPPQPGTPARQPPAAPSDAEWSRTIRPDPVLLFRYSALTFNGHRIHYDRDFCREEGYPDLVVHGPLTATLLLELVRDCAPDATVASYAFRAVSPLFASTPYTVNGARDGDTVRLWAANADGGLAMEATATLR